MPAKKPAPLFGVPTKDVKPDKLPTVAQYLKSTKQDELITKSLVELVWSPGKFKNFTLQTEHFRVIVVPDNPLFGGLKLYFADVPDLPCEMFVEITDTKRGSYMLVEGKEHCGYWDDIGSSGFKWVEP